VRAGPPARAHQHEAERHQQQAADQTDDRDPPGQQVEPAGVALASSAAAFMLLGV
jgi:hypothetical protein